MELTKQMILDDPYGACVNFRDSLLKNPEPLLCDEIYCELANRTGSFGISLMSAQDITLDNNIVICDMWDFLFPNEREIMEQSNHAFYQAWVDARAYVDDLIAQE